MTATGTTVRIAMWSGPRNISTAMMRSWGSRADCAVVDEPLYACYLQATDAPHPDRERVIEHHENDWRKVVDYLLGPAPADQPIFYQKHMAHHLLPEFEGHWIEKLSNAMLLREPAQMLASLDRILDQPEVTDTGLPQQRRLFRRLRERGLQPPVVDARQILEDPERGLRALCRALHVDFDPAMLSWEPGLRDTDGIWAEYWYGAVARSTGFRPYRPGRSQVRASLRDVLAECQAIYDELIAHAIKLE